MAASNARDPRSNLWIGLARAMIFLGRVDNSRFIRLPIDPTCYASNVQAARTKNPSSMGRISCALIWHLSRPPTQRQVSTAGPSGLDHHSPIGKTRDKQIV